jgi:putative ABC transport system permease protein
VILNESAVEQFGLGDDPIGMKINTFGGDKVPDFNKPQPFTVIGVVEDFHFSSLKENITPLGLFLGKSDGFLSVRFQGDPAPVIEALQKCWKRMAPGQPFQMSFLDQEFEKMYMNEQRLGKIFNLFAGLAIVIACFGLFAMTAYSSRLRTKEIGIRKVLGASVRSILLLLSLSVTRLLVLSFIISVPIAWYCMQWWLAQFSYRTDIGLPVYVLAGCVVFFIAWITMWHHAYRAASTDPVKAIKTE